jgi:hypothetical protein
MTPKNLPPLEVGTTYRARDFANFEFAARDLYRAVAGEDTAILRLHLANATILEIPAKDEDLHYLLRVLMEAYPSVAKEHAKVRGWL